MRSCGLHAMSNMLLAQEQGWHSCPMDGFDFGSVGKPINLLDDHVVSMMIAVGSHAQESFPGTGKLLLSEVFIENSF